MAKKQNNLVDYRRQWLWLFSINPIFITTLDDTRSDIFLTKCVLSYIEFSLYLRCSNWSAFSRIQKSSKLFPGIFLCLQMKNSLHGAFLSSHPGSQISKHTYPCKYIFTSQNIGRHWHLKFTSVMIYQQW